MQPVAVLEAKAESREPDDGLEQAVEYARALSVPHAISTNGREFVSADLASSAVTDRRPMVEFPGPHDLQAGDPQPSELMRHVRKRRLADISIRDEQGQIIENRRLRRLIFALSKRGWSDNPDGQQPFGLRLGRGDDEGDIPFIIEFVSPADDRVSPIEGDITRLYLFGNISVAKWLKSRPDLATDQPSSVDASLLYVSDGRYFVGEDQRHGTRTDRLPLSRFPTPEEMCSLVEPKPQPKRLQDLPRSGTGGGQSQSPTLPPSTQRSTKLGPDHQALKPARNAPRRSPQEVSGQQRYPLRRNGAGDSLHDRTHLVLDMFVSRGWRPPTARWRVPEEPVDRTDSSTRQFKLSAQIDGRVNEIAIVLVIVGDPSHLRHISQAAHIAKRDGLRIAFVTNGRSYVMKNLASGLQTGPRHLSRFPRPADLRRELAASLGSRAVDRPRPPVAPYRERTSRWKRLFRR